MPTMTVTLSGDRAVVMTREFDAPRQMVWDAMSKPELIRKWMLGPPGWTMTVCDDDARVGGTFVWSWRGPAGEELTIRGVNHEIVPPERGVRTEVMEMGGAPLGEQHATLVLKEVGQKTQMTLTLVYASPEARAGALGSGMEHGMNAGYERLDALLAGG